MDISNDAILQCELETVYELLKIFSLEEGLSKSERLLLSSTISKVKTGINEKFNIMYVFTDNIDEDEKNQRVTIPNSRIGKVIPMGVFLDELEDRKALGKKVLLDLNQDENFFRGNQE